MADLCALAWLYLFSRVCQALESSLESTFSKKDSASGNHSPDCLHFRAVITDKVTPTLKCKQNKQSNTANLRILEEEKQAQSKNTPTPSLRGSGDSHNEAIHKKQADSSVDSMDCHADKSARNDGKNAASKKVDSRNEAKNVSKSAQDSRISKETSANAERCPLFCDEKPLLFKRVQGRILGVCNRSTRAEIKGLSRKAESTSHLDKVAYVAA